MAQSPFDSRRRLKVFIGIATFLTFVAFLLTTRPHIGLTRVSSTRPTTSGPAKTNARPRPTDGSKFNTSAKPKTCRGPRRELLTDTYAHDIAHAVYDLPNTTYPRPTFGSYGALNLEQSWMTFEQRYGPYGYREEEASYNFTKVDWVNVKWGQLQQDCLSLNEARFGDVGKNKQKLRFRLVDRAAEVPTPPSAKTGRQAVVIRAWSTYVYRPEDYWNIRSIITEASLASGGEYEVILLVDVKDPEKGPLIHTDDAVYKEVLEEVVPSEFRDLAVLFHSSLQSSWYPKVDEVRPYWQIMQPLQLFAHFYPEYDHYWQVELDNRFTGDVGKMLQAFHEFSKNEPYKQARERASWRYIEEVHGTWEEFSARINKAMDGGATVWGPVKIDEVKPFGSPVPVQDPKDENFDFGVGQDADLLLYVPISEVNKIETWVDWVFKDWYFGFSSNVPRFKSVPAQGRASWDLLEGVHNSQHEKGLKIPGEATLPSWALWLGLKLIVLPVPIYMFPTRDPFDLNHVYNGDRIEKYPDGISRGAASYRLDAVRFMTRPTTFDWWSSLTDHIFDYWMYGHRIKVDKEDEEMEDVKKEHDDPVWPAPPDELPYFMAEVDGKVYASSFILHPRKTNNYIAPF